MWGFLKDTKNIVILLFAMLTVVFALLYFNAPTSKQNSQTGEPMERAVASQIWTCSMHPQIHLPEPGACPICGMDLIPLNEDTGGPWSLDLTDEAQRLAEVEMAVVERKIVPREIRMVGKVDYDEKRIGAITARVPGRIDRLFVDFTGIEVKTGDHMVSLYSPDLVSAQQELKQALKTLRQGAATLRKAAEKRVAAVREKMRLLGLSNEQIKRIEARDDLSDHLTIEAPMGGVVIKKHLTEGAYVQTGTPIYTIADLSRVWIKLDAYESDLAWIRYGQEVSLSVEAYPGESFKGRIVFIDPALNPVTRTVKVRVDLPNPGLKLKPEMFVRATVLSLLSSDGKAMDASLAGKWISPMHPEIVKDSPGSCDVCGMDLVRAEELGFITDASRQIPLVVPAPAVLTTGERAVVYVADPDRSGRFEGRVITLGPRAGDYYVVKSGLAAGERVVANGNFKIDSELQIRAKKSMMYSDAETGVPEETEAHPLPRNVTEGFRSSMSGLFDAYFRIQDELSKDNHVEAKLAGEALKDNLTKIDAKSLEPGAETLWVTLKNQLSDRLGVFASVGDLKQARAEFESVSASILTVAETFGFPHEMKVYRFHCPMAFDNRGADWLQNHTATANPYFGSAMFGCGSQIEALNSKPEVKSGQEGHDHD